MIPTGDPAGSPRGGIFDPPVAGSRRSQQGCWRRRLSLQLGTNRDRWSFDCTVLASRRSTALFFEPVQEIGSAAPNKAERSDAKCLQLDCLHVDKSGSPRLSRE